MECLKKCWLMQGFEKGLMSHYEYPDEVEILLDKIMNLSHRNRKRPCEI